MRGAGHGARSRRGRIIAGIVALVAVANAFVAWNLVATHNSTAAAAAAQTRTESSITTSNHNLSKLRGDQAKATAALNAATKQRNELNARNNAARAMTTARKAAITAAFQQITRSHGNMVSLNVCLLKVQAALNTVSVGDLTNGSIALTEVQKLCETQ